MKDLKRIVFGKGLMEPTLTGKKKITIRKYKKESHDFKKGDIVQGVFMDGLTILLEILEDTEVKTFARLTDKEAQEDGFENAGRAYIGLKYYYPDLTVNDKAGIIRFELAKIEGNNIVSWNEFTEK